MSFDPAMHPAFPFPRFRKNEEQYRLSKTFWEFAFFEAFDGRTNEIQLWKPWVADTFTEGMPIFSRVNDDSSRGIVLQQVVQTNDEKAWFKCWTSEFGEDRDPPKIPYLFIETFVHPEAKRLFVNLVQMWCVFRAEVETMNKLTALIRKECAEHRPIRIVAHRYRPA
jgi:hypothetical protein